MLKICIACLCLVTSCTYSIHQIHTEGSASDIVDENQRADADISPQVNIPVKPI